jgi:hypothetical protein
MWCCVYSAEVRAGECHGTCRTLRRTSPEYIQHHRQEYEGQMHKVFCVAVSTRTGSLSSRTPHMGNRRPAGRMWPSTSFDPALIHFSELIHIKLTSYDLRKTHHVFSHQGLFLGSWKCVILYICILSHIAISFSLSLFLSVFCAACQCLKHFLAFSTLVTLKSLKPLHVSA